MGYNLIAAICKGGGIGNKGELPWRIPEDLRFFSKTTKGNGNNAIVMGRTTWESLPRRPLPGRANFVLSRNAEYTAEGDVTTVHSIDEVQEHCDKHSYDAVWVIGGAEVYKEFLKQDAIDVCVLTMIHKEYECDCKMPVLGSEWSIRESFPLKLKQHSVTGVEVEIRQLVRSGASISPQSLLLGATD